MAFDQIKADSFLGKSRDVIPEMTAKSLELKDAALYQHIRRRIANVCNLIYQYSSTDVHFFGSRVIGVATDESDLDTYVVTEGSFELPYVRSEANDRRFRNLVKALKIENVMWEFKYARTDARIPVMSFTYLPMKVDCEYIEKRSQA